MGSEDLEQRLWQRMQRFKAKQRQCIQGYSGDAAACSIDSGGLNDSAVAGGINQNRPTQHVDMSARSVDSCDASICEASPQQKQLCSPVHVQVCSAQTKAANRYAQEVRLKALRRELRAAEQVVSDLQRMVKEAELELSSCM